MSTLINELTKAHEDPFWRSSRDVNNDLRQELYSYIIRGLPPGAFHHACFANDLFAAGQLSHPMNQWNDIQAFCKWLTFNAPKESFGSYERVNKWKALSTKDRIDACVANGLLLSDEMVVWETLNGRPMTFVEKQYL
jgi:hypothetical protein